MKLHDLVIIFCILLLFSGLSFGSSPEKTPEQILERISFFNCLSTDEISIVSEIALLTTGKKGDRIIEQDTKLTKLYVLYEGQASVWISGKYLLTLDAEQIFGEIEIADNQPASADVILSEDSKLLVLDYHPLLTIMEEHRI